MRRIAPLLYIAAIAVALVVGGCAAVPESDHPAVDAISELLELRRDNVRDAEAYAPYFLESSLATALAEGSAEATEGPRVPDWEPPYVSEATSETASVVVIWKSDPGFLDWPAINIFMLALTDDRWVVIDAIEATAAPEPMVK